jgi:hypothetical protein
MGAFGMPELFILLPVALSAAWYLAVIVFLWKIWKKVRHLPG